MSDPVDAQLHHLAATVHGRYWFVPAATDRPAGTLVGFHGYGEDAERLLEEMRRIPGADGWAIASIQALHPFYTRTGRVVASWMTKLDRELAIGDNLDYVSSVLETLEASAQTAGPFVYLGFSQGTAMAYRAALRSRRPADALVALAGDVPPELAGSEVALPHVLVGRGDGDTWYDAAKEGADLALLEGIGAAVELCRFTGGHEWVDEFREACGRFLAARAAG